MIPVFAEDIDAGGDASPSTAMLSEVSKRLKITIVGGSIPERVGDNIYNTCSVFGSDEELKAKHRKIHLFDINIPGNITFMESKLLVLEIHQQSFTQGLICCATQEPLT